VRLGRILGVQARPVLSAKDLGRRGGTSLLLQCTQGRPRGLRPGDAHLVLHRPVLVQTEALE